MSGSSMKRGPEDENSERDDTKRARGSKFEVRLLIPSKVAGGIIGKGGCNIQKLRSENNAVVKIPDCPGPERVMLIEAETPETIMNVISQSIPFIADEMNGDRRGRDDEDRGHQVEIRLLIHQSLVGGIIGKGGSKIKEIKENTGANMKVYGNSAPQSSDRVVAIKGSPQVITSALGPVFEQTLEAEIRGHVMKYDPINFDAVYAQEYGGFGSEMDVMGAMGGPRGPVRGHQGGFGGGKFGGGGFQGGQQYGDFASGPDFNRPFGGDLGNDMGDIESTQVTIPKDMAGAIIGPGGNRIRSIRNESHCKISIGDSDATSNERIITIDGTHKQIQMAQYLLQQAVRDHGVPAGGRGGFGEGGGGFNRQSGGGFRGRGGFRGNQSGGFRGGRY